MSTSAWRRYNIFLSSTFKDMDFERDVIKFRVIPALNRRFRDRRVELQAIDLRLGVNTQGMSEDESERKVLSVCTSCIDSARPFFIGLIGQRYGWVPPMERWQEFIAGLSAEERDILKDTAGCSVTEMEIVYGALSQGSFDSSHVLFFLRDNASYEGIPEDMKPVFCDTDHENLRKLAALRDKVQHIFGERAGEDDRCTPYHLNWKDGRFDSDEFEALVTEQLARQIDAETAREEQAGEDSWWAREKELEESTLLRLLPGAIKLDVYDDEIPDQVGNDEEGVGNDEEGVGNDEEGGGNDEEGVGNDEEGVGNDEEDGGGESMSDVAVWYVQGFGASTHMAQDYDEWSASTDVIRLLAVFGLSEYSTSMRPVIARWIHELAERIGREELPDDEQLLGKMSQPELFGLFEELVQEASEDNYIYLYMDDVEALETTSPKDLYIPWLERVKDRVNVYVNLQDGSEARKKLLNAYPHLRGKLMLGVENDEDAAEALISNYEQTYFLELPEKVKSRMLKAVGSKKDTLSPLKIHSIFRIFESLTQEDFREIRSRKGSQIDAINGYLEDIWKKMPDAPYDIMTFMVNQITANLGLGENMRQAIWTIAAAPGGLRESDIAHFAAAHWDTVQFYRAMNFLHDFFYEDRGRHTWRAKYITRPEDGLGGRQKQISEYLLTLDPHDSLRETMGLYYAIGGCDPSHFAAYMDDGDYLHDLQMTDQVRFQGPQIRQLLREGHLESKEFKKYCKALPAEQRLRLMIFIVTALADLEEERNKIHQMMSEWLDDVDPDTLSGQDAFSYASIIAVNKDSIRILEKALEAARLSEQKGCEAAGRLISMVSSLLIIQYQKLGKTAKARQLQMEAGSGSQSLKDRLTALNTLVARAGSSRGKNSRELLDRFFEEYYAAIEGEELNQETFGARFNSSRTMLTAFTVLMRDEEYARLVEEAVRFIPSMKLFYSADNFFSWPEALQTHLYFHMFLGNAASRLEEMKVVRALAQVAASEAYQRLMEVDPENPLIGQLRHQLEDAMDLAGEIREVLEIQDVELKDIDELIEEAYAETQN